MCATGRKLETKLERPPKKPVVSAEDDDAGALLSVTEGIAAGGVRAGGPRRAAVATGSTAPAGEGHVDFPATGPEPEAIISHKRSRLGRR